MLFGTLATDRAGLESQLEAARRSLHRIEDAGERRILSNRALRPDSIDRETAAIVKANKRIQDISVALASLPEVITERLAAMSPVERFWNDLPHDERRKARQAFDRLPDEAYETFASVSEFAYAESVKTRRAAL